MRNNCPTAANFSGPPGLAGMSVRDFLSTANTALGGGSTGFNIADLASITAQLNAAFLPDFAQKPSAFAEAHLRFTPIPTQVREPATGALPGWDC